MRIDCRGYRIRELYEQLPNQPLLNTRNKNDYTTGNRFVSACLIDVVPMFSERTLSRPWDSPILSSSLGFGRNSTESLGLPQTALPYLCLNNTRDKRICQEKITFLPIFLMRSPFHWIKEAAILVQCCHERSSCCVHHKATRHFQTEPPHQRSARESHTACVPELPH